MTYTDIGHNMRPCKCKQLQPQSFNASTLT